MFEEDTRVSHTETNQPIELIHVIQRNDDGETYVKILTKFKEKIEQIDDEPPVHLGSTPTVSSDETSELYPETRFSSMSEWWELFKPIFSFNNPRIRSRLEKLMGSNVVRITDRKYMIKLQERIKEDHMENQKKRIQEREAEEVEREKKLILEGKISIEDAPRELKDHPVCKINQITKKILEEKKIKGKGPGKINGYKTPGKKIKEAEKLKHEEAGSEKGDGDDAGVFEEKVAGGSRDVCSADADPADEVAKGFMFSKEEYEKLKYEAPLVKMLREVENVEDMYKLAEEIVGPLKHQKTSK